MERAAWDARAYAGFWQRAGGYLIDLLLLLAVALAAGLLLGVVGAMGGDDPVAFADRAANPLQLVLFGLYFAYDTVLTARYGATLGKRAAGVEVRRPDGTLPSYGVAVGRYFARALSVLPLGLGYLWVAFDPKKRTFHDMVVTTVVVRRTALLPAGQPPAAAPVGPGAAPPPERTASGATRVDPAPPSAGGLTGDTLESARWGAPAEPVEPAEPVVPVEAPARPPEPGRPAAQPQRDPNRVAIERARLGGPAARWLQEIAGQVDPRLDRVTPGWRASPQAEAARACAFGILLGHLSRVHPHMAGALGQVAEVHPSFSTLLAGSRLATLEQIAAEPARATAWLGPLIDVEEPERIARLLA